MADPQTDQQDEPSAEQQAGEARANRLTELLAQRGQQHGAVLQAQGLALRSRQQVINEEIAQQRFDVQQQAVELSRIKALSEIEKEKAVVQMQIDQHKQSAAAVNQLGQLDPNDPQYTVKMAKIFNENPMASKDPVITEIVKSNIASRHVVEETGAHIAEFQAAQDAEKAKVLALRDDADARDKAGVPLKAQIAGDEQAAKERAMIGADVVRGKFDSLTKASPQTKPHLQRKRTRPKNNSLSTSTKDLYNRRTILRRNTTFPISLQHHHLLEHLPLIRREHPRLHK